MRIAVISDTHLHEPSRPLIDAYANYFSQMDVLVHCGDFTAEEVWSFLNSHPRFYAVSGNMDLGLFGQDLPRKRVIDLDGYCKIGIMHGFGLGFGRISEKIVDCFESDLDLICYGHTHIREWKKMDNQVRLLNPGSFTLPKGGSSGFAIVHAAEQEALRVEWVNL